MVPPVLKSIVDGLGDVRRISILNNWEEDDAGRWHLLLLARLSVKPSQHMPSESKWRLVVSPKQPDGGVFYYPDAEDGIRDTFRHQDQNSCSTGAIWRAGKPCLERPIRGLGRTSHEQSKLLLFGRQNVSSNGLMQPPPIAWPP